jgi:hypothetical protein
MDAESMGALWAVDVPDKAAAARRRVDKVGVLRDGISLSENELMDN